MPTEYRISGEDINRDGRPMVPRSDTSVIDSATHSKPRIPRPEWQVLGICATTVDGRNGVGSCRTVTRVTPVVRAAEKFAESGRFAFHTTNDREWWVAAGYVCRACTDGVVQAPAPARLIPAGLPTEATVTHMLVAKYADHLPLYRQSQIMVRQGIDLDRSTLADWVGRAAYELRPVFDALIADLKRSNKLFMDETRAPVLDPGSGKTKTGYFWALARDDRPWGGNAPLGVAFTYAPGRSGQYAEQILQGFTGILQVDGYAGYNRLIAPDRVGPNIQLLTAGLMRVASLLRSRTQVPSPLLKTA